MTCIDKNFLGCVLDYIEFATESAAESAETLHSYFNPLGKMILPDSYQVIWGMHAHVTY